MADSPRPPGAHYLVEGTWKEAQLSPENLLTFPKISQRKSQSSETYAYSFSVSNDVFLIQTAPVGVSVISLQPLKFKSVRPEVSFMFRYEWSYIAQLGGVCACTCQTLRHDGDERVINFNTICERQRFEVPAAHCDLGRSLRVDTNTSIQRQILK